MATIPLTRRGAELLREELQRLKSVERHAVIQAIAEARAQGDLSENAEYDAAKDKQGFIEGRIQELESKLAAARSSTRRSWTRVARWCSAPPCLEDESSGNEGHLPDRRRRRGRPEAGTHLDQFADCPRADRQGSRRCGRGTRPRVASAPTRSLKSATSRLQRLLAALWAGQLLAVALLAAPNAFATLERTEAGAYVARLFQIDARLSMALGVLLMLLEQRRQRNAHPGRLRFGVALVLPLMALLLTLGAQEVLRPLMDTARGGPDFGWLHGLSMAAFAAKTLCVLLLAWVTSSCSPAWASRA
jgi:hypothetical protein